MKSSHHRNVLRKIVVEGGWGCRKDCTTLVGRMKRNVVAVTKKKVRRSPDFTTARVGLKSEVRSHRKGNRSRKPEHQRRNESGKEAS